MENKISSSISWHRCCLRRRLHEHRYEVCFGPPLRVGDGSSVLPGGLLLPGRGLCRRLWIRPSSSPIGVLADGLSVSQIHLDRRSGVVDLAAFPCCGGCRWRIWKWWLRFGLWLLQIEA